MAENENVGAAEAGVLALVAGALPPNGPPPPPKRGVGVADVAGGVPKSDPEAGAVVAVDVEVGVDVEGADPNSETAGVERLEPNKDVVAGTVKVDVVGVGADAGADVGVGVEAVVPPKANAGCAVFLASSDVALDAVDPNKVGAGPDGGLAPNGLPNDMAGGVLESPVAAAGAPKANVGCFFSESTAAGGAPNSEGTLVSPARA